MKYLLKFLYQEIFVAENLSLLSKEFVKTIWNGLKSEWQENIEFINIHSILAFIYFFELRAVMCNVSKYLLFYSYIYVLHNSKE